MLGLTVAALASPPSPLAFRQHVDYGAGGNPMGIAFGDFNRDGRLDLLTANNSANNVSLLRGDGAGAFGARINFPVGLAPWSVAVGDFNGDTDPDVAVVNEGAHSAGILAGLGNGSLSAAATFPVGSFPLNVAVADLNSDGFLDLAVANDGSGSVSVLLGQAGGVFGLSREFPTGAVAACVAIADFNGDGHLDLAVSNYDASTVSLLFGNGGGDFGGKVDLAVEHPLGIAAADLNTDGVQDLVVTNYLASQVSVLRGLGGGSFDPPVAYWTGVHPRSVAVADLSADGVPDIVTANEASNTLTVLLGIGAGDFAAGTAYATGRMPWCVAIADVNADGAPDLACVNEDDGTASILLQVPGAPVTTTALSADPNPASFGQPVLLTASLTPATAYGSVRFFDGATLLGTSTLQGGRATLLKSGLLHGEHPLVASYLGSDDYRASTSDTLVGRVDLGRVTVDISSNVNPSLNRVPVTFTATVAAVPPAAGTPAGTVQFRIDGADFGAAAPLAAGTASTPAIATLTVGAHTASAVYLPPDTLRFSGGVSAVITQTVAPSEPVIVDVRDVPHDQGGWVFLTWHCALDQTGVPLVKGYRIWRRVPYATAAAAAGPARSTLLPGRALQADSTGTETFWESIADLPAARLVSYGYTASTPQDSIAGSNPWTAFIVQALMASAEDFLGSAPDSGYSVDNLSPPAPAPFTATYLPGYAALHWGTSRSPDLREFRLHRGTSAAFLPAPSNLLVATRDTGYVDHATGSWFYKLAAIDVHGNASLYAAVSPESPVATLASLVSATALADRVRLRWYASGNAGLPVAVQRRTDLSEWVTLAQTVSDGAGYVDYEDANVVVGTPYGYRLGIFDGEADVFAGETWVTPEAAVFSLVGARPNPAPAGRLIVEFTLPSAQSARLELLDIAGRRIDSREVGSLGPGRHAVGFGEGARLRPAVYLVRLTQGERSSVTRVAVLD